MERMNIHPYQHLNILEIIFMYCFSSSLSALFLLKDVLIEFGSYSKAHIDRIILRTNISDYNQIYGINDDSWPRARANEEEADEVKWINKIRWRANNESWESDAL